jgi:hypothetical protein
MELSIMPESKKIKEINKQKSQEEHPEIANLPGPQQEKNLVKYSIEIVDGKPVIKRSE